MVLLRQNMQKSTYCSSNLFKNFYCSRCSFSLKLLIDLNGCQKCVKYKCLMWSKGGEILNMQKVIVIGGGPAGMMAAITASKNGHSVILIEKMRTVGRKLSITGKGRCNITNNIDISDFIKNIPGNGKFLYSAFTQYTNEDLIKYFNSLGVATKVERGERIFPVSDDAMQVVNALKRELDKYNVKVLVNTSVKEIIAENNMIIGVQTEKEIIKCDTGNETRNNCYLEKKQSCNY